MEFLHTMIRVEDLDAALNFFCKGLGMVEVNRSESEKGRFTLVFLVAPDDLENSDYVPGTRPLPTGLPMIELTYNWPDADGKGERYNGGRNFGHLAYRVKDIYAVCQHLMDMGVTINRPPRDGHMAFVRSPDNISIELLQKGDHLAPSEPWASMDNTGEW